MSAEVLYTRVPGELKAAVDAYARERARSTSACVAELVGLGYEAATETRSLASLTARVAELEAELAMERAKRAEAEQRNGAFKDAAESWASRANRPMGRCGECGVALAGSDYLVAGACPSCGADVAPKLIPD